jgi:D-beta-D-heptose 7-phosphate kinase/D-beta-D-heptose 1-phosphate adenosyltransferase
VGVDDSFDYRPQPIPNQPLLDEFVLDKLEGCTLAVIGDLMLDCYIHGDVERISPEAPVPILQHRSERNVPGGAANVASNLASLGARVRVVGITGADEARITLIGALQSHGPIIVDGILVDADRPTTKKLRVMSVNQQIARIDVEKTGPISIELEEKVMAAARVAIAASDIVIVSDYGKGLLTDTVLREVFHEARRANKTVLVDPKRQDWAAYRGASILTPNRRELFDATGLPCETDADAAIAVAQAKRLCDCDILLTRSDKGMSLYRSHEAPIHMPTVVRDVFDVSGAGDTVIAVLAAALVLKVDIVDALRIANHAAGIVVGKLGTATVTSGELLASLSQCHGVNTFYEGKLVSREVAKSLREQWARDGLTVGLANGCFDLLHPGHISLIRQAAEASDRLIVALNSDASVKRLKGNSRPVQDEVARASVMGAIKGVSAVTIFDEDTPLALLEALRPDVLVKGADYKEDEVVGADLVKAAGGRVLLATLVPGRSTTALIIRDKILAD